MRVFTRATAASAVTLHWRRCLLSWGIHFPPYERMNTLSDCWRKRVSWPFPVLPGATGRTWLFSSAAEYLPCAVGSSRLQVLLVRIICVAKPGIPASSVSPACEETDSWVFPGRDWAADRNQCCNWKTKPKENPKKHQPNPREHLVCHKSYQVPLKKTSLLPSESVSLDVATEGLTPW